MKRTKGTKKVAWAVALVALAALAVWVSQRWNVWFHNKEDNAYV